MQKGIMPAILALFALTISPDCANSGKPSEVLVYSNICLHAESGDILGNRLILLRFPEGDYVYFQAVEGAAEQPLTAKANLSEDGSEIEFNLPNPNGVTSSFKGRVSDSLLTGEFDRRGLSVFKDRAVELPRVRFGELGYHKCKQ